MKTGQFNKILFSLQLSTPFVRRRNGTLITAAAVSAPSRRSARWPPVRWRQWLSHDAVDAPQHAASTGAATSWFSGVRVPRRGGPDWHRRDRGHVVRFQSDHGRKGAPQNRSTRSPRRVATAASFGRRSRRSTITLLLQVAHPIAASTLADYAKALAVAGESTSLVKIARDRLQHAKAWRLAIAADAAAAAQGQPIASAHNGDGITAFAHTIAHIVQREPVSLLLFCCGCLLVLRVDYSI